MELARSVLIFSAIVSLTAATYYRSHNADSRRTSTEEESLGETERFDKYVVKKATARENKVSETEDKNEESDLQGAASLQDYISTSFNPYSYYPYYLIPVDEGVKTVQRPIINAQGSVSLPGLHVDTTIGEGASHGGGGGGAAAAAAAAAAAVGDHSEQKPSQYESSHYEPSDHKPSHHEPSHNQNGGGNGATFAAAGSIAGFLPTLQARPVHQGISFNHGQPAYHGGAVQHGGAVPVRPSYGGHPSAAGGVHGIPVQYIVGGGYGSQGSQVHYVGGVSQGSYGGHGQPAYHVVSNHRPQVHTPVQHVSYRPTNHVRPPYSWSNPSYSYHREIEPLFVVEGLPNIHAVGGFNYGEGATSGLGGIHTTQGNPLVISVPVVEGNVPITNVANLFQRPLQVIASLIRPHAPERPNKPTEDHGHKPVHEQVHKPVHEPAHKPVHEPDHKPIHEPVHKPVHEPVHKPVHEPDHKPIHEPDHKPVHEPDHKPVHEPDHKPVHETVQTPIHVSVQAVVHKNPSETEHKPHYVTHDSINQPQYRPGYNKGEGVNQPTIKPAKGQFSKSNIANVAPELARSDSVIAGSKTAGTKVRLTKEGSAAVAARADPIGADLPSLNTVDNVPGTKEGVARSGLGSNVGDSSSTTTGGSRTVDKDEPLARTSDDWELQAKKPDVTTVKSAVLEEPAPAKTATVASTADSGSSTVSSKKVK